MIRKSARYIITVTFDIHRVIYQGRKYHYEVRTRKLKWGNLVPLRSSTGSNSCASSISANTNPICIICGEHYAIESLHAAGAFHASKSKLNTEDVIKLTIN